MNKTKKISIILFISFILVTSIVAFTVGQNGFSRDRTDGCSCHGTTAISLSHNITGSYVELNPSDTFDIAITLTGQKIGQNNDEVAWAFWHSSGDGIGTPVPQNTPLSTVNNWAAADLHYHANFDADAPLGKDPWTEVFTITAPGSVGIAYLDLKGAGSNQWGSPIVQITINVSASDNTPPAVIITAPSNNAYVSGTSVAIIGTVIDLGSGVLGSSVEAYVTNTTGTNNTVSLSYTDPGYSGTWDSTSIFDGDFNITVKAQDNDGNTNVTEYITVKADNTAPSIAIDSVIPDPSNGITVITASNSSSDIDVNGIRANITDPSSGETYVDLIYQGINKWNGTFTVTQNGDYTIYINATDFASNTATVGPTSITGDVSIPTITLTVTPDPSNGVTTIQAFNTTDVISGSLLANVSTPSGYIYPILTYQGANQWTGFFDVKIYGDGLYTTNVNGTDLAGNVGYAIPVDIDGDLTNPTITLAVIPDPSNGITTIQVYNTTEIVSTMLANVSTPTGYIYPTLTYQGANQWIGTFDVKSYGGGLYTTNVNSTDLAGNIGYATPVNITGDLAIPTIILTVIPDPSNGITTIQAFNTSEIISTMLANVSTPSGYIYPTLIYQGVNQWAGTFDISSYGEGLYTINVNGTDLAGNIGYATPVDIDGDLTNPTITLTVTPDPSNGITTIQAYNTTEVISGSLLANVSTPSGYIYPTLTYQGANQWTGSFDINSYGDGSYTITINGTDLAGNVQYNSTSIDGDITLPTVTIISPTEGENVGGAISITGTAIGTGSNIASIYINNTIWGDSSQKPQTDTATGNPSGSFTFDNKSYIAPGNYWVEINITDYAGNVNSSVRYFIVTSGDSTPPNIIITVSADPSNGFTNITVTSNEDLDAGGPPLLNITLPNTSVVYRQLYLIATRTWQTNYTVISEGTHTIAVNATDIALNIGYATTNFEGDLTAPTITLLVTPDPSNGITTIQAFNTTEVISGSLLANVSTPSGFIYPTLTYQGANQWTGSFDVGSYGEGVYTINVNGTDLAGNVGYATPVVITGDLTAPTITLLVTPDPSNGITTIEAFNTTEVISGSLLANVSTPSGFIYPILVYQGANQWTGSFDIKSYGEGVYTINVNGTDLAGNVGYATSVDIDGDLTAPTITLLVTPDPSNGITTIQAFNTTEVISGSLLANVSTPSGFIYPTLVYQGANQWIGSFDIKSYGEGIYTININGTDLAGNVGYATPVVITGDLTAPIITLLVTPDPSNGITIIQAFNTTEVISGSLLANVSTPGGYIYPTLTYQGANQWTGSFDIKSYGEGVYTINVNGTDLAGNVGYVTPVVINGDLTAPTITLLVTPDPSNGITTIQAFNTTEVISGSLLANVSTPSGFIYPTLVYQGANQWTGSFDVNSFGDGPYTININGTDLAGNVGYATPVDIDGDLTTPTITLLVTPDPSNGITTIQAFNTTEVISGSLLANVSTPNGFIYPTLVHQGANQWTGSFDVNSYGEGIYIININGTDLAGNVGYVTPANITGDLTPPIITINQPSNSQIFNETAPTFNISIVEANFDSAWYTLDDGTTNTTIIGFTGSINQGLWDFIPNGNVTLIFYANDTLGHIGFNAVIIEKDILDIKGPLITGLIETNDPTELGQSISINVNVFDISNISSVQIEIQGIRYNMTNIVGEIYEYQWIPVIEENLLYTIYANDTAGNSNSIIDSVLIQDTTLPQFSNLNRSSDLVNPGEDVQITLDATDISGIYEVIISVEGINYTMIHLGGNTWSYTLTAQNTPGTVYFTIIIVDNNDNVNSVENSFRVKGTISGITKEPVDSNTIQIFLGVIGLLGIANLVLIFKKFRGGKS
ncbi:MAG: beta strand repeat-containing protein [Promethearchaeota archaeon]